MPSPPASITPGTGRPPPPEGWQSLAWVAVLGMLVAVVIFAGNFVLGRRAILAGIAATDLVALRYGIAGLVLLPVLLLPRGRAVLARLGWRRAVLLAALGGAPYYLATAAALVFAPAGHGVVLNPGTVTLAALAIAATQGERLGRWALLGVPMMIAGLLLVAGDGIAGRPGLPRVWVGDLLLVGSGVAWAFYGVLLRRWGLDALSATAIVGVLSLLAWLPPYLVLAGARLASAPRGEVILQGAFQGLLAGGAAIVLYSHAVSVLGVARAALFPPLVPVIGLALAAAMLQEAVGPWQAVGMGATVAGMALAALRGRPRGRPTG